VSAALLLATLATPTLAMAPLMVALGIGLNGTSSVLYATVAKFVPVRLRARYYGFFYTSGEGGSALAPIAFGLLADMLNVRVTTVLLALLTATILPMSLLLRKHLDQEEQAPSKESQ
jgi:MFS family permease